MATQKRQRIGIWIIAVVLTVGTLAGFLAMIIAPQNDTADQANLEATLAEYQAEVAKQSDELSAKYYDQFVKYEPQPAKFDANTVTKVATKDLKVGTGETIKEGSAYSAYYIGWNPKGKVFDQSIDGDSLKAPIAGGNLIEGWNEGVIGMKLGGVRVLSIPAEKAYGATGSGDDIPADTPIKFVVMAIPTPKEIPVPQELLQAYGQQ